MGIEPTYPAWKAGVLPLNYTRIFNYSQVGVTGFEPATSWSQTRRSSQAELRPAAVVGVQPKPARKWQSRMVAVGCGGIPIHAAGIDLGTADAIEHADAHLVKVTRIFEKLGKNVARHDGGGGVPIGIEGHVTDLAGQRRCRPLQLSAHDIVPGEDDA